MLGYDEALDRSITGNYGEDQLIGDIDLSKMSDSELEYLQMAILAELRDRDIQARLNADDEILAMGYPCTS